VTLDATLPTMPFEILGDSAFAPLYHTPREFADQTADTPVIDFGQPMSKIRVTVLLKSASGPITFAFRLADDAGFTENVQTLGDHILTVGAEPSMCVCLVAVRGGQRYGKLTASGTETYDARVRYST
jgi:hypothetical protein